MLSYVTRRVLYMFLTLFAVTLVGFLIIQLPPGDYLTNVVEELRNSGADVDEAMLASLTRQYGLDQPVHVQYAKWMWNFVQGNFGRSFEWNQPVKELIGDRMALLGTAVGDIRFQVDLVGSTLGAGDAPGSGAQAFLTGGFGNKWLGPDLLANNGYLEDAANNAGFFLDVMTSPAWNVGIGG